MAKAQESTNGNTGRHGPTQSDFYRDEHNRFVAGNQDAAERLAAALLSDVPAIVRRRLRSTDYEIVGEAVDDAVMDYLKRPAAYDPARGTLLNYIGTAAIRNVLNARRGAWRRFQAEGLAADSVLSPVHLARPEQDSTERVEELLSACCDATDVRFARAWLNGGTVDELATLIGVASSPHDVRKEAVRRRTECLRQRFKRYCQKGKTSADKS